MPTTKMNRKKLMVDLTNQGRKSTGYKKEDLYCESEKKTKK